MMRNPDKRFALLVWFQLLCLLLLLSGCDRTDSTAPLPSVTEMKTVNPAEKTFGIIYPMAYPSYESITTEAVRFAGEHGVRLIVKAPDEANTEQQIRILESMIEDKVDGIAISPLDSAAVVPVIDRAAKAGIPVICFESDSPGSSRLAYIGADNEQTGIQIAKTVSKLLGGKGMIIVENGMAGMLSLKQKQSGLLDYLREETAIDVLDVRYHEGSEDKAMSDIEEMISAHPHFDAIIALDYISGSAATLVWKAKGLRRYAVFAGLAPEHQEALDNGQATSAISQNETRWGQEIVNALLRASSGLALDPFIDTGISEVSQ